MMRVFHPRLMRIHPKGQMMTTSTVLSTVLQNTRYTFEIRWSYDCTRTIVHGTCTVHNREDPNHDDMDHHEPDHDVEYETPLFIEIRPSSSNAQQSRGPDRIEVLTCAVDPQNCGPLLKELSKIVPQDESISHLKRVKRSATATTNCSRDDDNDNSPPPAKKAKQIHLQVLMGRKRQATSPSTSTTTTDTTSTEVTAAGVAALVQTYNLTLQTTTVPGRSAESALELQEFNAIWPTLYFQKNTLEHAEQDSKVSHAEVMQMVRGIQLAYHDDGDNHDTTHSLEEENGGGAVILDPVSNKVISTSHVESLLQSTSSSPRLTLTKKNPLCTPILLALQGVSRLERMAALGCGMESEDFKRGQYLCTGYDIYVTKEPTVFEAMALVHSRMRRVVFGVSNTQDGGLGGTGESSAVHCLPATNHRYRVFKCVTPESC